MKKNIIANALVNAGATAVYIMLVVLLITSGETIFKGKEPENALLIPVVMLILFVVSASITGLLVLGKPIMWYLDGKKKEAFTLFGYTLGFLVIIALLFVLII